MPAVGERLDRFEEACEVVTSLLRARRTTFNGTHYELKNASMLPRPVSQQLPILVGGAGEYRTMRIAVRYADIWHAWATPADFKRKCDVLDRHCTHVGRDPASLERATGQLVTITGTAATQPQSRNHDVIGSLDQVVEALTHYDNSRVSEFIIRDHRHTSINQTLDMMTALTADASTHLT